jgi:phosphate transport system substrate-binding protein
VIAAMFSGKITNWSDPKIAALNPGTELPKQDLLAVYRSDSSGTTAVFTDYLAKVSESWKTSVGAGKTVKWPVGLGGKGNDGVAAAVKGTTGAIGYVELTYSASSGLPMADVKNKSGNFVTGSVKTVSEAAAGSLKSMPEDFRISITNAEGKNAYPISSFTYLLVSQKLPGPKGSELVKFLGWAIADGQKSAPALSYAPLPAQMVKKVKDKVATIKVDASAK